MQGKHTCVIYLHLIKKISKTYISYYKVGKDLTRKKKIINSPTK